MHDRNQEYCSDENCVVCRFSKQGDWNTKKEQQINKKKKQTKTKKKSFMAIIFCAFTSNILTFHHFFSQFF